MNVDLNLPSSMFKTFNNVIKKICFETCMYTEQKQLEPTQHLVLRLILYENL